MPSSAHLMRFWAGIEPPVSDNHLSLTGETLPELYTDLLLLSNYCSGCAYC